MRSVDAVHCNTDWNKKRIVRSPQVDSEHRQLIDDLRLYAQQAFSSAPGSHDWPHSLRVHKLCLRIGPCEGADMVVLETAAYLHDIGRVSPDHTGHDDCHAIRGARMAKRLLDPLPLTSERKGNIVHCVRSHRYRSDCPPQTIEARVLFDADKLDAIGAIGIAQAYQFAGELGACLHNPDIDPEQARPYSVNDTGHREFAVKLSKIKDRMTTDYGRRLAKGRHAFMMTFFERFLSEYEGCDELPE